MIIEWWLAVALMSLLIIAASGLFIRSGARAETLAVEGNSRDIDNLCLYQQRLEELNKLLTSGEIDQATFDELVDEAQRQILAETGEITEAAASSQSGGLNKSSSGSKALIIATSIFIPLTALLLYLPQGLSLGGSLDWDVAAKLKALETAGDERQRQKALLSLADFIDKSVPLSRGREDLLRLQAEVYSAVGKNDQAVRIYRGLLERDKENATLTAYLAQAIYLRDATVSASNAPASPNANPHNSETVVFSAEASQLLKQALQLDPQQYLALSLSGMQAFTEQRFPAAIKHWQAALLVYGENSPQSTTIKNGIQAAQRRLLATNGIEAAKAHVNILSNNGANNPNANTGANIRVRISIDPEQLLQDDAADTPVFVFARAVNGPRMPLAAKRLTLADLPIELLMTENDRMATQSIAGQSAVIVGARLARSGQPIAQAGDSQSDELSIAVMDTPQAAKVVELKIKHRQ